jgi:quercetin dioxygenase-like cupin family protein
MNRLSAIAIPICSISGISMHAQAQAAGSGVPASSLQNSHAIKITPADSQKSSDAPAEHFTRSVELLFIDPSRAVGTSVSFEPGARTAWHSHPLGQTLLVTEGTGWIQKWGELVVEIRKGDVIWIPAGTKHWHGATQTSSMTHIAITEQIDSEAGNERC